MIDIINDETIYTFKEVEAKFPIKFIGVITSDDTNTKCRVRVIGDDYDEVNEAFKAQKSGEYTSKSIRYGVDLYNVSKGGRKVLYV